MLGISRFPLLVHHSEEKNGMNLRSYLWLALVGLSLGACVSAPTGNFDTASSYTPWTVGTYRSRIPHAPKLDGWKPIKSVAVKFREYEIHHPNGTWVLTCEDPKIPIRIITASGRKHDFANEWYPEEGGADAAAAYGFVKGDETLIVFQGTSDITYEETHFRFKGDELTETRRYASKGGGMGPDAPGVEPKHKVYPPL